MISLGLLSLLTINFTPLNVNAEDFTGDSEDYTEYKATESQSKPTNKNSDFSLNAIDLNGYEYIHSYATRDNKLEFSHLHENTGTSEDSVNYTVSVTQSASATVSASASFDIMIAKAGFSAEVQLGVSRTKSLSVTWTIPPKSKYLLRAGSSWIKASGTENRWYNGKIVSTKSVTGDWTYTSWSDKVKQ